MDMSNPWLWIVALAAVVIIGVWAYLNAQKDKGSTEWDIPYFDPPKTEVDLPLTTLSERVIPVPVNGKATLDDDLIIVQWDAPNDDIVFKANVYVGEKVYSVRLRDYASGIPVYKYPLFEVTENEKKAAFQIAFVTVDGREGSKCKAFYLEQSATETQLTDPVVEEAEEVNPIKETLLTPEEKELSAAITDLANPPRPETVEVNAPSSISVSTTGTVTVSGTITRDDGAFDIERKKEPATLPIEVAELETKKVVLPGQTVAHPGEAAGLNLNDLAILHNENKFNGRSINSLSQQYGISRSTITAAIDWFDAKQAVERSPADAKPVSKAMKNIINKKPKKASKK